MRGQRWRGENTDVDIHDYNTIYNIIIIFNNDLLIENFIY